MKKQADVVMLTTEKATSHISMRNDKEQGERPYGNPKEGYLSICIDLEKIDKNNDCWDSVHLYFVSGERISKNDWCFYPAAGAILKCTKVNKVFGTTEIILDNKFEILSNECQKIIATTNPKLWKDGVGKIGFDFIHLFIKKSNEDTPIKQVMLEYEPKMQKIATGEVIMGSEAEYNLQLKTRSNGTVIVSPVNAKEYTETELFENMQYYMEHCQMKGYVTPQEWLNKHKHF